MQLSAYVYICVYVNLNRFNVGYICCFAHINKIMCVHVLTFVLRTRARGFAYKTPHKLVYLPTLRVHYGFIAMFHFSSCDHDKVS